jgi:hypothetical protein
MVFSPVYAGCFYKSSDKPEANMAVIAGKTPVFSDLFPILLEHSQYGLLYRFSKINSKNTKRYKCL